MDRFIIDRCDQSVIHNKGTYSFEACNTLGIFFPSQLQAGGLYERKGEVFTEGKDRLLRASKEGSSSGKETASAMELAASLRLY